MNKQKIVDVINDLVRNEKCNYEENHINYRNENYSFSVFGDEDIWKREVIEDNEIIRGSLPNNKYYILDKLK